MASTPRGRPDGSDARRHHPRSGAARRRSRPRALRPRILVAATVVALTPLVPLAAGPAPAHAGSAGSRGIAVPPAYFGIHDGSSQAYGRVGFGSIRLWDAGVTWAQVETSRGVYDWQRLDSLVSAAQAHHVQVTLVLAMTPSFAGPAANQAPTDLADYAAYVRAVMSRYRDFQGSRGIAAYQVWNEGNVSLFWQDTPASLARLTQVVDQVRDQVDPGATVLAPSFAVRTRWQRRWLAHYESQSVAGTPVWRFYDANGFSLYPKASYDGRPGGPEDAMALLGRARRILARAGVPASLPVWATEINYGLKSGDPGILSADPIPERRQVANVLRTYLLGAARGLARVFWYRYDWGTLPASRGGGTLGNTLLTVPGQYDQVTPAGQALATVERWLRGRLVLAGARRPCAHDRRGTYTCVVRHAGRTRTILWNPHRTVRVRLRDALSRQDQAGRTTVLSGRAATVEVGYRPVMVVTR